MRKAFLPLVLILCSISTALYAGSISISDAQLVAVNFYKTTTQHTNATVNATLKYTQTDANNNTAFYVFDMSPVRGFVIVAADDNVIPVLGYSTEGNFHTDFQHTGLNHWTRNTATNISLALQNNARADAHIQQQWTAYRQGSNPSAQRSGSVTPLVTTTWDQENMASAPPYLYNLFCPYYTPDHQRALTGCEATAMAQIMKFWNYPAQGMGSFSYTDDTIHGYSNNYGVQSSNFAAHTYQWSAMPTILDGTETTSRDSAVDILMYDCGVSVGMDYGDDNQNGSGAEALIVTEVANYGDSNCVQYALVKYFSYDADTIKGVVEADYTPTAWTALIEHEMDMGRPVLYEGNDATQGGHAWVCDGYDATDKLHMNWGWSGADNGYFAVNNLTTSGNFNPIQQEDALIGILPKHTHVNTGITTTDGGMAFHMYPNPAKNDVMLQTTASDAIWTIKNLLGQTMVSIAAQTAQTHIDLSGFPTGMYIVELQAGEKSATKKLVISR